MAITLLLLSMLTSLTPAAPLPAAHPAILHSPHVNVTAAANATVDVPVAYLGEYLTSALLSTLSTVRRCGGRRAPGCVRGGGRSYSPSPPPPPPPTRIAQSLSISILKNTSQYTGLYKEVVEAGWGISIGIYAAGWISGVSATSSASRSCNADWCGIEILFRATVPSGLSHHTESLSPSSFCNGVVSAKAAVAHGSTMLVPNATHVKVMTTTVDAHVTAHEDGRDWAETGFYIGVVVLILCGVGTVIGLSAMHRR